MTWNDRGRNDQGIDAEYRIRAHHGMCFAYFQGKGYSGAFTENMWKMKERLDRNPTVAIVQETDDVCARCPNDQEGVCTSAEKVAGYDRQVLEVCGLAPGSRIKWNDFANLVQTKILDAGKRKTICGDCQWDELCR